MDTLKDELQQAIRKSANFDKLKDNIEMTITPEGLRIELLESAMGTFFQSGVAAPTDSGKDILVKPAQELGKLPNRVSIEGHTDSKPFCRARQLRQLGTIHRPRQYGPPADAGQWHRRAAGNPGARLCRSAFAEAFGPHRPTQPRDLSDRPVPQTQHCIGKRSG